MWAAKGEFWKIQEIMHRNVRRTSRDINLDEAAREMLHTGVGCLLAPSVLFLVVRAVI